MKKTWKEIVEAAIEAGFGKDGDGAGLHPHSERDGMIYVDEYPVGDDIARMLEKLGIEIVDEQVKPGSQYAGAENK